MRRASGILWPLVILAGLVIAAFAFFDTGIEDDGRLSQKMCSDYAGIPPADCVNPEDVLITSGGEDNALVERPIVLVIGLAIVGLGLAMVTGLIGGRKDDDVTIAAANERRKRRNGQ